MEPPPSGRVTCLHERCNKTFATAAGLKVHTRIKHQGLRSHACTHARPDGSPCAMTFAYAGALKRHISDVHLGVRACVCTHAMDNGDPCTYAFTQQNNLKRHIQTVHLRVRGFLCPHAMANGTPCNAQFGQKVHMHAHVRAVHFEEYRKERKLKESAIEALLTEHGYDFSRQHYVSFRCAVSDATWAYTDALLLFRNTVVILEVDEDQHDSYGVSCDVKRMALIVETLRTEGCSQRIVFVRYNPDGFSVNGVARRTYRKGRHDALIALLRELEHEPDAPGAEDVRTFYMFYDTTDGEPAIFRDDYDALAKQWFVRAIV